MSSTRIVAGAEVSLHFSLGLPDGSIVDSNFDGQPATFTLGDGNLLPGFEACLLGLGAGDSDEFTVAAAAAFGRHNEDNVQRFRRDQLGQYDLQPGLVISFADAAGAELPGVVVAVDEGANAQHEHQYVTVDFNHPLADRDIIFKVNIIAVRPPASAAESAGT